MFYGSERAELRDNYFTVWEKHEKKETLTPLEQQITTVILEHPEYHAFLKDPEKYREYNFSAELGETNPFMHMGLHLGVRDQVSTNMPQGVAPLFRKLLNIKSGDHLEAEHVVMQSLTETMWEIAHHHQAFDETKYLERIRDAIRKSCY